MPVIRLKPKLRRFVFVELACKGERLPGVLASKSREANSASLAKLATTLTAPLSVALRTKGVTQIRANYTGARVRSSNEEVDLSLAAVLIFEQQTAAILVQLDRGRVERESILHDLRCRTRMRVDHYLLQPFLQGSRHGDVKPNFRNRALGSAWATPLRGIEHFIFVGHQISLCICT